MADETKIPVTPPTQPGPAGPPQQTQVQIPVDVSHRETVYTNFYQVTPTTDEVFLDVAAYAPVITQSGPEPLIVTHRLIMNFVTAKKLAETLRMLIARHEQAFGVVEVDPNRRLRVPPQQPRPPMG